MPPGIGRAVHIVAIRVETDQVPPISVAAGHANGVGVKAARRARSP